MHRPAAGSRATAGRQLPLRIKELIRQRLGTCRKGNLNLHHKRADIHCSRLQEFQGPEEIQPDLTTNQFKLASLLDKSLSFGLAPWVLVLLASATNEATVSTCSQTLLGLPRLPSSAYRYTLPVTSYKVGSLELLKSHGHAFIRHACRHGGCGRWPHLDSDRLDGQNERATWRTPGKEVAERAASTRAAMTEIWQLSRDYIQLLILSQVAELSARGCRRSSPAQENSSGLPHGNSAAPGKRSQYLHSRVATSNYSTASCGPLTLHAATLWHASPRQSIPD